MTAETPNHICQAIPQKTSSILRKLSEGVNNHQNENKTFEKGDYKERFAPGLVGNKQEVQTNSTRLPRSFRALTLTCKYL